VTEEDLSPWLGPYRLTATEEPTPALDEAILTAARGRAMRVRTVRRGIVGLALTAVVISSFWSANLLWVPQAKEATDYGRQEGATRYYLLNVAAAPHTGIGSKEPEQ
jgi:hypothetical protein